MENWLVAWLPWGHAAIVAVQTLRSGWLDPLMVGATMLGDTYLFVFVAVLIYWCMHKSWGVRLIYLALLSTYFNSWIKQIYRLPRPADPRIVVLRPEESFSFPSGHSQQTFAAAGYLGLRLRRAWVWAAAVAVTLLVSFSRIYVGVHFPQDILGGWLFGALLLAGYILLGDRVIAPWLSRRPLGVQLAFAVGIPLILLFLPPRDHFNLYPGGNIATTCGALLGASVGLAVERRYVGFAVAGSWARRALRIPLGVALAALTYFAGRLLAPHDAPALVEALARVARYALIGLACAGGAPWLFVKLGLAGRR